MIECEGCGRDTPQVIFEQPYGNELRAKCNVCGHITIERAERIAGRVSEGSRQDANHGDTRTAATDERHG